MARAAVHAGDGGALTSRFEVVFADAPAPAELAHAFATLSVACRLVDREAGVLTHDAAVATEYLRRWNTNEAQQSNQPTAEY
jgi:crotonobetainyl-CoA:carnitine CoA-transferase CaiB-like acyl-CoA transferase